MITVRGMAMDAGTNNVTNSGIMHLGAGGAGRPPVCKSSRAHMTFALADFEQLPVEYRCKKCQANFEKFKLIKEKRNREK